MKVESCLFPFYVVELHLRQGIIGIRRDPGSVIIEEPALETKGTMERVDRLILDSLNFDVKDIMLRVSSLYYHQAFEQQVSSSWTLSHILDRPGGRAISMHLSLTYLISVTITFFIAFQAAHGCKLKSLFMGNKLSAAAAAGTSAAQKSIFDYKVDAISGTVDLSTYRYHLFHSLPSSNSLFVEHLKFNFPF